ncbi:MAG: hypothetical protein Kow00107_04510 [Planctomycetota bacterium]
MTVNTMTTKDRIVYGSFNDIEVIFLPEKTARRYADFHQAHREGVTFEWLFNNFHEFFIDILEFYSDYHYQLSLSEFIDHSCDVFYMKLFKALYQQFKENNGRIGEHKVNRPIKSFLSFQDYYQNEIDFHERVPVPGDKFDYENIDGYDLRYIIGFGPGVSWAPKSILEKFSCSYESIHDGTFTIFPPERKEEIRDAFVALGFECEPDYDLISRAYGEL